ncbi:MAG: formate C-acetyltransferase/glycerol dehydratase family glycyl radical enzyme [Deltaproteobacteria bacterium]|nr:formate C-acetyltransferase/glycerol dehydratase family glycyl radical enzyme [Deltaproteobacteria bacterium]
MEHSAVEMDRNQDHALYGVYGGTNGKGLRTEEAVNASPRVQRMREHIFNTKPSICIERAHIVYDYYNDPANRSLPVILQRAGAFRAVLERLPIAIEKDELLVGNYGSRSRSYPMIPETIGDLVSSELDTITDRITDPLDISDSDRRELQKTILPFWKGKTHIERLKAMLSPEEYPFFYTAEGKGTGIMTANASVFGAGGHVTMDFPTLLRKGFRGIKAEALGHLESLDPFKKEDLDKTLFYRAVVECCEGMTAFAGRFADLAGKMAAAENDPERRKELEDIARVCERVPVHPARHFHEAVQSVWFAYLAILQEDYDRCCSLGRPDQYLHPFYEQDIHKGIMTEERAQELLDCLWLKLGSTNFINWGPYIKVIAGHPMQQQITVGGQTPDGLDATNPVTLHCIQATMNTRLHQPSLSVRLHKGTPKELYHKAGELVRMGTGHPSFFNDEVTVPALADDVPVEVARDCSAVGCAGIQVSGCGKGSHNGGYLNLAAALEFALTDGYWRHGDQALSIRTGDPLAFTSFDQFFEAFEAQLRHIIRTLLGVSVKAEYVHKHHTQTPYISSLIEGCLESGRDKTDGGARYNFGMNFRASGLADIADSLAAVKKFVFEEKTVAMPDLVEALNDNFEGHETLQQTLLNQTPRYGNGNHYVDGIARDVLRVMIDEFSRHKSCFGGSFQPGFGSVSGHWPFGAVLGAFPDGRKAGEPLANGIGPVMRQDHKGPTAILNTVGAMDNAKLSGGSILNLKFPPEIVAGEEGLDNLTAFLKSFVDLGVWHCQFNIVDADTLREAQRRPEDHRDLLVRVAGYSAYFTGLPRDLQDDIIERTEHRI